MHLTEQKTELRASIQERLDRLTEKDRGVESRTLCKHLLKELPETGAICGYAPLKTEPDIRSLLTEIIKRGQPLFLPCFGENELLFRQWTGEDALTPGPLRTLEPSPDAEPLNAKEAQIILVPGRAFALNGQRLGRGNGGFDIWIEKQRVLNPSTQYWGIAFECQIVREIPMEPHDQLMDAIVTARGFHPVQNA